MKIGQLSERTGASPRSLRYYEQQGLLQPARMSNGYRDYDEVSVAVVSTIQAFLNAGLSTEVVREVLSCTKDDAATTATCPELLARVMAVRDGLEEHAARITAQRERLDGFLVAAGLEDTPRTA
ncbi:MAG: MerR family transcriptional regulator [Pseudonocardia sp.]|nr:MerR family transcriptional regulator [Pseudonocardia sp.]